jgi:hypothetical protein
MNETHPNPIPEVWSDMDGTMFVHRRMCHPYNWSKWPIKPLEGYADFIRGVHDSPAPIAGAISRRPRIRRKVTELTIEALGLADLFDKSNTILAGSENNKADFLVDRSREKPLGIVDDKPHKLGMAMVRSARHMVDVPHYPIVLGVVAHDRALARMNQLAEEANAVEYARVREYAQCFRIEAVELDLRVMLLPEYSYDGGRGFGQFVLRQASQPLA